MRVIRRETSGASGGVVESGVGAGCAVRVDVSGWGDGRDRSVEFHAPPVGVGIVAGFDEAVVVGAEQDEVV